MSSQLPPLGQHSAELEESSDMQCDELAQQKLSGSDESTDWQEFVLAGHVVLRLEGM